LNSGSFVYLAAVRVFRRRGSGGWSIILVKKAKFMITKKTKIIGIAAGLVGLAAVGVGAITAQAAFNGNHPNFGGNMVNAIAQKFNLNSSDVQQVVDEQFAQQKEQMDANRQQTFTDRLNKAVTDGKLTQDQADKITAEKASIDSQIAALNGKTGDDLKTAMKQIMDSEKQWATDNNIPQQYLMPGFGGLGAGKGYGKLKGMGQGCPAQDKLPCAVSSSVSN
jgi:hypothetical protein